MDYKFNEGELVQQLKEYIDATYDGHYSKNKFQSTEFIIDCGHGEGFALGNVLKYVQRYGKKNGKNRADLLKVLHYAIIALSVHDEEIEKRVLQSIPDAMDPEGGDPYWVARDKAGKKKRINY
tara:strand:- start:3274 stop:3642 length:369 start_codon:yes stop_codon:yes gene_type:complete